MSPSQQEKRYGSIVIVGCGRLGSLLAGKVSQAGLKVFIIDRDEAAFDLLPPEFSGFRVTGDAVEQEVLRAARLEEADCLVTVTEKDTLNLMVAQVGRVIFSVPKVLARIYDPRHEALYHRYEIETISPTKLTARAFFQSINLE